MLTAHVLQVTCPQVIPLSYLNAGCDFLSLTNWHKNSHIRSIGAMRDWVSVLAEATSSQEGLVSTAQLRAAGVIDAQIANLKQRGLLKSVTYGVWASPLAPPDWQWRDVRAAWIRLDPVRTAGQRCSSDNPRGVVRAASAALVWDIGALDADETSFAVWGKRLRTRQPVRVVNLRQPLGRDEWCVRHGLPVTSMAQTVADLADELIDGDHLERIAADAVLVRGADPDSIARALHAAAGRYGYAGGVDMLREALSQRSLSPAEGWLRRHAPAA